VGAGPVLLPLVGQALGNAAHGQAGGIRGDQRAGFADLGDAREQRSLDLQVFCDGFDDPVGLGAELQVVFKIAGDDALLQPFVEKRRGAGFRGGGQARANNAVADLGACQGKAARFFRGAQFGRDNIEQRAPDAGVGHVRGDARTHRPRS
jgi:hypothetical protein